MRRVVTNVSGPVNLGINSSTILLFCSSQSNVHGREGSGRVPAVQIPPQHLPGAPGMCRVWQTHHGTLPTQSSRHVLAWRLSQVWLLWLSTGRGGEHSVYEGQSDTVQAGLSEVKTIIWKWIFFWLVFWPKQGQDHNMAKVYNWMYNERCNFTFAYI